MTDLSAEATLDPAIVPASAGPRLEAVPGHIFLTGATGFLGAFLLHDLLRDTVATVHCLVRAAHPAEGRRRLEQTLASYGLWDERFASRIVPVVGDLARPLLGISTEQFRALAGCVDVIYHCGALVNFIYPYATLKPANVRGTEDVLRLACQSKVKPVHYVSALDVFASLDKPPHWLAREDDDPEGRNIFTGYGQSKWVAERLVLCARSRGLPTVIYRPGLITGHSETGACNTGDVAYRMLKSCLQLGSVPDLDISASMAPVDYISNAMIYLSRRHSSLGRVFHLVNPHPVPFAQLADWIRDFGYPLRHVSYARWRDELIAATERSQDNALYPLLPFFGEVLPPEVSMRFECQHTLAALAGSRVACPPLERRLITVFLEHLIRIGFLPSPPRSGVARTAAGRERRTERCDDVATSHVVAR